MAYITSPANPSLEDVEKYISEQSFQKGLGIFDASESELLLVVNSPLLSGYYFADMISRRAQIGW